MLAYKLPPIEISTPAESLGYVSVPNLKFTEMTLDRELLNSPVALAQKVEVELIKNLRKQAPWLIPLIMN